MPNWCHNKLIVSGDKEEVDRFIEENRGKEGDGDEQVLLFSKSVPEPEYKEKSDGGPFPDWYKWRIQNWGTKWEPDCGSPGFIEIKTSEVGGSEIKSATYYFETAWGPGYEWLQKTAPKYPKLRFCLIYGEPGGDYGGIVLYSNGEVMDESEGSAAEYLDPEMMWF